MNTIRIFLVDDHYVVCEGLSRMLEQEDDLCVVGEAYSGEEALEKLGQTHADIVLLDVRLPGMSGIEALRRLKESQPDIKVLMLTSFGDEYLRASIEAGASGYVLKRANRTELVGAIHDAIKGGCPIDSQVTGSLFKRLSASGRPSDGVLSPQLLRVLQLIAAGMANKEIANQLDISEQTVKNHVTRLFEKLNANDRTHAVTIALRMGLINNPA